MLHFYFFETYVLWPGWPWIKWYSKVFLPFGENPWAPRKKNTNRLTSHWSCFPFTYSHLVMNIINDETFFLRDYLDLHYILMVSKVNSFVFAFAVVHWSPSLVKKLMNMVIKSFPSFCRHHFLLAFRRWRGKKSIISLHAG